MWDSLFIWALDASVIDHSVDGKSCIYTIILDLFAVNLGTLVIRVLKKILKKMFEVHTRARQVGS